MEKISCFAFLLLLVFSTNSFGNNIIPDGAIPSEYFTAKFVLYDSPSKQKKAIGVVYDDGDIILKDSFPGDYLDLYYKLEQSTPAQGYLLVKIVREYKKQVDPGVRNTINLIHNEGFYIKKGLLPPTLEKQTHPEKTEKRFTIQKYQNFVALKPAGEEVENFIDLFWAETDNTGVARKDLRKFFEYDDYSDANHKLFSCLMIHHLSFSGTSYIRVNVPVAETGNNLECIYIEVVEIRVNTTYQKRSYCLRED